MSDDKEAIRAAAVGQDFGDDTAEFDPAASVTEEVQQDHRGSIMREFESYERIVEGLKLASDGARNMVQFARDQDKKDAWNKSASFFDQIRRAIVQDSGYNRLVDTQDSKQVFGGEGMTWSTANSRILTGLKDAEAGASQIALGQRLDLRWTRYSNLLRSLRDKAGQLAIQWSPLHVDSQWGGGTARMQ